ncbi:MAG: LysM domain-containing protein [Terriglobales bacterium]
MFSMNSRYFGLPVLRYETPDGRQIAYAARRFLPQPSAFALLMEHTVTRGERLDLITAKYLDDPEQFWRICDANAVMSPFELEKPGNSIRITLPQGIPGPRHG